MNGLEARTILEKLAAAEPGTRIVYYAGLLSHRRTWDEDLDRLAETLFKFASRDEVYLFHRRRDDGVFDYIAIKAGAGDAAIIKKLVGTWTRSRIEHLKRLDRAGVSPGAIAQTFGISRQLVTAKLAALAAIDREAAAGDQAVQTGDRKEGVRA